MIRTDRGVRIVLMSRNDFRARGWRWRVRTKLVVFFDNGNSFGFVPVRRTDDIGKAFLRAAKYLNSVGVPPPETFG